MLFLTHVHRYKLMTYCWKKYGSERIHFAQIVEVLARVLENVHNSNRDSYYSDDDSDIDPGLERQPSRSSRTPSLRSGEREELASDGLN